jgi:hypothetical protein
MVLSLITSKFCRYKRAKERAREMDMDITPELVKARDALRYSAGMHDSTHTRQDPEYGSQARV